MKIKTTIKHVFQKFGYDVVKYDAGNYRWTRLKSYLDLFKIGLVLDIGANTGQFAEDLIEKAGFKGRIYSFEPLSGAYELLHSKSARIPGWRSVNYAIGSRDEDVEINVSDNSVSSSILNMSSVHLEAAPSSKFVNVEKVQMRRLDTLVEHEIEVSGNVLMKIDTQGYEAEVLKGAKQSIAEIDTVLIETSFVKLYEDQPLFGDVYTLMNSAGFTLISIEPGFSDPNTGIMLQADAMFHREKM